MNSSRNVFVAEVISDTELAMQRMIAAPRELIYRAFTEAELIPKWWGLRNSTTVVDTFEPRVGGKWRFVQREADGSEYAFRGEFLELDPPGRIVQTFEFEPMPGHVVTDTLTLSEIDGGTLIRINSVFESIEDRDGMLRSGMEAGANETYDRLEELVATLA